MTPIYPFAAIVGQEQLKQALLICAVDPTVGGVLVRGDKGSAKSTAARGLAAVLPPIRRAAGCGYNCEPEHPLPLCPVCSGGAPELHDGPVPFINLPLGATEDRVLGSLDFEKALQGGKQAFKPGLLAGAHRGMLYIDEVNLLADHLVDVLLDAAAMGVNTVEREGLAVSHPARVTLLGTMNQEEGDLRPQLLDRFGLMVDVAAPREPGLRAEVVRRRLAFEADPAGFAAQWQIDSEALRENIAAARALLPQTRLSDSLFHFVSELCCEFDVTSLRADIVLNKAARALAALDGRADA
ncbi:ATP-binding protein, partial [Chromobacterium piscinae]